ncbi:MAG: hypothetical protein ACYC6F_09570 [Longimicrobiales bacterium]
MEGSESKCLPAPVAPTPVRAAMVPATAAPPEATERPAPDVLLEADGVRWVVRELGRSGSSKAPLLLVGFFHPEGPGEPRREAWVVARALEHITQLQLEEAWRSGGPSTPPGTRRPFFAEIADRSAKEG